MLAVGAVGAYNWRSVKPRLEDPEASKLLMRTGKIELAFAAVVLVLTAVLVHLPMPGE